MATKLSTALQVGDSLVWNEKQPETKSSAPPAEDTQVKQPYGAPANIKEPEPVRPGLDSTPTATTSGLGISRPATSANVEPDIPPTPDISQTPAPSFPPNRDEVTETPLPNLPDDELNLPPPTPTFHPPPGEPILQKKAGDLSSLPSPFGKTVPPLPFKLSGNKLPPVQSHSSSEVSAPSAADIDNLPNPPDNELPPTYEEVEMADKLSGKKKKKHKEPKGLKEPKAELESL